ncbi:MAG: hypothetical protein ABI679_10090 [Gemmatimonadota bacterium]
MIRTMLVLHIFGFVLWIGGAYAIMTAGIAARREERSALGALARMQGAIYSGVVGPGAGITIATGLVLTFKMFGPDSPPPTAWLMIMQTIGLVAGVITLAISLPLAGRIRRIDPMGPGAPAFDALRNRQKIVGMVSGLLGLVALVAGAMTR